MINTRIYSREVFTWWYDYHEQGVCLKNRSSEGKKNMKENNKREIRPDSGKPETMLSMQSAQ